MWIATKDACCAEGGEASYPAFREELVCSLVESLLGHPQGVVHGLEEVEVGEEEGLVGTMKAAARAQAAGSLVDWLGTAKIALQVGPIAHNCIPRRSGRGSAIPPQGSTSSLGLFKIAWQSKEIAAVSP